MEYKMDTDNEQTTLGQEIQIVIGILKGNLQTFKLNLEERLNYGGYECSCGQYYNLKLELVSFLNSLDEIIIPLNSLLFQNINSIYHLTLMELCCWVDVNKFRDDMEAIEQSDDLDEIRVQHLWKLCHLASNATRIMITIAEMRLQEIETKILL